VSDETTPDPTGNDEFSDIEAMLRELDAGDLELQAPPPDIWEGIAARLEAEDEDGASVVPLRPRRPRYALLALAAAVVVAIGVGVITLANRGADEVIAVADLTWDSEAFDPLGSGASASAELVEEDGRYEIRIVDATLPDVAPEDADLELWMISLDADGAPADVAPISLVDAGSPGTYRVPADIDPDTHFIIDISIEPRDGDDAHSGRSILRGPLEPA